MKLAQLGEAGLIDRIRSIVGEKSEKVVFGIGDDAAIFRPRPGWMAVLTTDALVEGVHFDLRYTPVEALGWKALAINMSDVAAMGGLPRYAVVSLALPERWRVEDVESLYKGMVRCGKRYECEVIGGDTVRSKNGCFLSVTVVGEGEEGRVVGRDGAKEGDLLCVTGQLGEARVGLEVLASGGDRGRFPGSVNRFLEPNVRLREARWLVAEQGVSSMIDISDGLSSEIGHLCQQSGLGCLVWEEKIPVAQEAVLWTEEQGKPLSAFVLESGEEYELLVTVDKARYEKWRKQGIDHKRVNVTAIGEMTRKEEGMRIVRGGETIILSPAGWDHFDK